MELSARLLSQITGCSDIRFGKHFEEKRGNPRLPFAGTVQIHPYNKPNAGTTVRGRDISTSGLGLLSSKRMELGEQFVARLPRRGAEPVDICCMVTRCESIGGGLFMVGAGFERILTDMQNKGQ